MDGSGVGNPSLSLGGLWFLASPSWDIQQDGGQDTAYFVPTHSSSMQGLCPVPVIELQLVENPVKQLCFYFRPQTQTPMSSCFLQPPGADMVRAFSHLALLLSFLLPPFGLTLTHIPMGIVTTIPW